MKNSPHPTLPQHYARAISNQRLLQWTVVPSRNREYPYGIVAPATIDSAVVVAAKTNQVAVSVANAMNREYGLPVISNETIIRLRARRH